MDLILYVIGFSFSFFFILLSYWKEDKQLHIIGSVSLMIMSIILITGVQTTKLVTVFQNVTGNLTSFSYSALPYTNGAFYESLGIGVMLAIFAAIEYLYFALVYNQEAAK